MFFLFAGLYLRFSKFISKAGYETPVRCYIVALEVSPFSFLFHCDQKCIQFLYSVRCAKNQLILDQSFHHNATHVISSQRKQSFSYCQKLTWFLSDSSRYSDFFSLRFWQTVFIKSRELGIRCFSRGKLCSPLSAVSCLVMWDILKGLSLHCYSPCRCKLRY